MGIKCPLQDMFKGLISAASVVATALTIGFSAGFSAPALAGTECDSVKAFAQSLEQISGKPTTVECYEKELEQESVPAPSREGAEVFLSLAALLAGGWGLVAALSMSKSQPQDWDYGFSPKEPAPPTSTSSSIIWWEEVFNPSDLNWEDLNTSTIEWNELDISDIQWNDDDIEIEWDDLSPIQWDDLI